MNIPHIQSCPTRSPIFLIVLLWLPFTTGCGMIYQHRLETPVGTIWTNDDIDTANRYKEDLNWMESGLRQFLPGISQDVGAVTILIGSSDSEDHRIVREQEVHTAGWYNRILSLVRFTPASSAEVQFLSQESNPPRHGTLLHEVTHHFTSNLPDLRSRWWLTEGFACFFETAFRDRDDQFILPPLHVSNYRSSRSRLRELGAEQFSDLATEVIHANWLQFYSNDSDAPLRYAISWSILWTLQQQMTGTLEQRLLQVAKLDDEEIISRIPSVIEALIPPLSDQLRLHLDESRYRRWAIEEWLENDRIDGQLILSVIESELLEDDGASWGWPCIARTIFRWGSGLQRSKRLEWQKKLGQQLRHASLPVRLAICQVLPEYRRSSALNPVLIELLESEHGELRALAAKTLARNSSHPTIVNPAFWLEGSPDQRAREVENWKLWLNSP